MYIFTQSRFTQIGAAWEEARALHLKAVVCDALGHTEARDAAALAALAACDPINPLLFIFFITVE